LLFFVYWDTLLTDESEGLDPLLRRQKIKVKSPHFSADV
jgi:hypothetical protein